MSDQSLAPEPDEAVDPVADDEGTGAEELEGDGAARTPESETSGAPEDTEAIEFSVVTVETILFDLSESSPQVHLMEADEPYRNLSIPIALPEAQALYRAVNDLESRRPGTHELTSSIFSRLQVDVIAARIVREVQGVYYAELDLMTPRGREVFDSRTSDALILASLQRVPAPILCNVALLDEE